MQSIYNHLAKDLHEKVLQTVDDDKQYWVAIAGGPGSGKSTSAETIRDTINQLHGDDDYCVVLPMDGFHYSREKLAELDPPDGANLLKHRGAPRTFDAKACVDQLKQAKRDGEANLPIYDRLKSDPIPGGAKL